MGLDTVEMIMAIEHAFQVRLPEEELGRIRTVGDLYDCLLRQLPDEQVPAQSDAYTGVMWERYIDVIEREIGADRSRLRPTATFVYDLGLY
jgi:Phosphopantetheine attachment site